MKINSGNSSNLKFKTLTTNEECTAAQLLAETMCVREAQKKRISLPHRFWNTAEWKKKYKSQILAANVLLKIYSPLAILNALKRKECSWQYSLRINGISDIIDEEQRKLDSQQKLIEESKEIKINNTDEFRQIETGKQSRKSKLD
jgi:hypothetical protein